MGQKLAAEPRRAPLYRFARRAVVLAALAPVCGSAARPPPQQKS